MADVLCLRASKTRPERFYGSPFGCFLFHYSLSSCINKVILSFPYFTALTFQGKCDFKIGHHPKNVSMTKDVILASSIVPMMWSELSFFAYVIPFQLKVRSMTNSSAINCEHVQNAELWAPPQTYSVRICILIICTPNPVVVLKYVHKFLSSPLLSGT